MKHWWYQNRMRLIQFNLTGANGSADPAQVVQWLKDMHANAVMIGAGGITAFYRSTLPYVYMCPSMGNADFLGEIIRRCHANSIRVIGRFDFSKIHESIAAQHPQWLYRDTQGQAVNYHGMVHTCVCGDYQNLLCEEMLRDCLVRYPLDGLYFNMFGFAGRRDYDGIDHGICQCDGCRKRFKDMTGLALPLNEAGPHMGAYGAFQNAIVTELTQRVHRLVKSIDPDISICTHDASGVDMVHTESNYALHREPEPFWLYASSDQCRMTNDSNTDVWAANCIINAADIAWRFMGVSPYLTQLRLWQNVASGSQPEFCIVGLPQDYPDRKSFNSVREVFEYHEQNQQYLGQRKSLATLLLVHPPHRGFCSNTDEYQGVFKALKEKHFNFDVVTSNKLDQVDLTRYKTVIFAGEDLIPDAPVSQGQWNNAPAALPKVDMSIFREDVSIIATGDAFVHKPGLLSALFGGTLDHTLENTAGAYFLCDDKQTSRSLPDCDWVLEDGRFHCIDFEEGLLPYMAPGIYGPVEIAGGTQPGKWCGMGVKRDGKRINVLLPWQLGTLYERNGFQEHRDILVDALALVGCDSIATNAHDMVEIFLDGCQGGRLLQLVNLTGYNGTSVHRPIPMQQVSVTVPCEGAATATDLRTGKSLPVTVKDGALTVTFPELSNFGSALIQ